MSNRAIRRAAERQANKAAAKAAKLHQSQQPNEPAPIQAQVIQEQVIQEQVIQEQVMTATAGAAGAEEPIAPTAPETEPTSRPLSDAKLAANRANAQKSTGPVTPEGRAKSSLNAVKTGLTGQTVLLSTDDAGAYQAHVGRHVTRYSPANEQEQTLVQMMADAEWRILRIPGLEAGIYALGRRKLADLHPDEKDAAVREALITGEVQLAYRRDLSNLALQERRLRNQYKSDLEKLQALQTERLEKKNEKSKIQQRMLEAIQTKPNSIKYFGKFEPAAHGFEFSLAEIEHCEEILEAAHRRGHTIPCVADVLADFRSRQKQAQAA